jgi:membrane associated rhomboid family serine protease
MDRFHLWYSSLPPIVRVLMTVQVAVYVTCMVLLAVNPAAVDLIRSYLRIPGGSPLEAPWTLLTYAFVHTRPGLGGFLEVAFNVAFLYWIGEEQERMLGGAWVLTAWGLGALGGGLVALLSGIPYEGSDAAVIGLIFATAIQFPFKSIGLLLLGAVRLIWVGVALIVFEALGGLGFLMAGLGGAAGGALMGALAQRGYHLHGWVEGVMSAPPRRSEPVRRRTPQQTESPSAGPAWRPFGPRLSDPKGERTPSRHEIDRILEKISDEGMDALTPAEREALDAYSRR